MSFQPNADDVLTIRGVAYRVAEHPASPGMAFALQGRQSIVYQLIASEGDTDGERYALKVFEPRFRLPALVGENDRFVALADMPGLQVCRREILSVRTDLDLLKQHPDLSYAILMPWIKGPTWMEVMLEAKELTPQDSLRLASSLAGILVAMEENSLAHCDLSGDNVIVAALASDAPAGQSALQLVDLEQLYSPDLIQPTELLAPMPGYSTRKTKPRWRADADRMTGAILLAEILGWCDEQVQSVAWGEHYFDPKEIQQQDSERYQTLRKVLRKYWGRPAASLLKRVWRSESLSDCPTFSEWLAILPEQPADAPETVPAELPVEEDVPAQVGEENDAAIRALIALAVQLEGQDNVPGAQAAARQALALPTSNEVLADELDDVWQRLAGAQDTVEPPVVGQPSETSPDSEQPEESTATEAAAGIADEKPPVPPPVPAVAAEPAGTGPAEPPPVERQARDESTGVVPPPSTLKPESRDEVESERAGLGCFAWAILLLLGIAVGAAIYYFVFMQHNEEVIDTLSSVLGQQPAATVETPGIEGPGLEDDMSRPTSEGTPMRTGKPGSEETGEPRGQRPPPGEMASPPPGEMPPPPLTRESGAGVEDMMGATVEPGEMPPPPLTREPGAGADDTVRATAEPGETALPPEKPVPKQTPTKTAMTGAATFAAPVLGLTETRPSDGMVMVAVPPGEFRMGTTITQVQDVLQLCREYSGNCEEGWFDSEQPPHQVTLEGFWIDRTEISNEQFADFLSQQGEQESSLMSWIDLDNSHSQIEAVDGGYQAKSDFGDHPVGLVSWEGADAYCKWAGGSLPTEAQWEYAARGPESFVFPWGNQFDGANLNYQSSSDGYNETAPVGSFAAGASWCDALNLSGNVAEWAADWLGPYKEEAQEDPTGPALGQYRVNRGGSFRSAPFETRGASRGAGNPGDTNRAIGFRCVVTASE